MVCATKMPQMKDHWSSWKVCSGECYFRIPMQIAFPSTSAFECRNAEAEGERTTAMAMVGKSFQLSDPVMVFVYVYSLDFCHTIRARD